MPEDAFYVFEKARWLFVKPSFETNRSLNAREAIPNAEDAGKLMRRSNGRFAIVARRLNVQLGTDILSRAERASQSP